MEKLVTMNLPLWWVIKDLHKSIAEPIPIKFKLYLSCKTLMIRSDGPTCQILLFSSLESSKYIWKFIDKWICFIHFLGNLNNWKQVFVAIAKCPHLWKNKTIWSQFPVMTCFPGMYWVLPWECSRPEGDESVSSLKGLDQPSANHACSHIFLKLFFSNSQLTLDLKIKLIRSR